MASRLVPPDQLAVPASCHIHPMADYTSTETIEDEFERWAAVVVIYLNEATPQQKHYFIANVNYDDLEVAPAVISTLVEDDGLDAASAQLMFWKFGGGYFLDDIQAEPAPEEDVAVDRLQTLLIEGATPGTTLPPMSPTILATTGSPRTRVLPNESMPRF